MEENVEWLLFTLAFILGYITCKTFYFYNATRTSIIALKTTHITALAILTKSLEDFYYAKAYRMQKMVESEETDHNITAFSFLMEEEIDYYKKRSIQKLIESHPDFFKQVIEFDDWRTAMTFLEAHKDVAAQFLIRSKDDRPN